MPPWKHSTAAYVLSEGFIKREGIFVAGAVGGAAHDAHQQNAVLAPEGRNQAFAGITGGAGLQTKSLRAIKLLRIGIQKCIGIFPIGIVTAGEIGRHFLGLRGFQDQGGLQRQPGHDQNIPHSGVMAVLVDAIGIGKMRSGHAQRLCLAIHFGNEGMIGIPRLRILVAENHFSRVDSQNIGRIVSAGNDHALNAQLHRKTVALVNISPGGIGVDPIHFLTGGEHGIRGKILQPHIGAEQLGDAGRRKGLVQIAMDIGKSILAQVIDKGLLCGKLQYNGRRRRGDGLRGRLGGRLGGGLRGWLGRRLRGGLRGWLRGWLGRGLGGWLRSRFGGYRDWRHSGLCWFHCGRQCDDHRRHGRRRRGHRRCGARRTGGQERAGGVICRDPNGGIPTKADDGNR